MKKIGQLFRLGMWTVKSDNIPEFIKAWQASVDWIARNLPNDGEGVLLQDSESPNKFISFAFSANPEKAQEAMSRTEFQELFSRVRALCEDVRSHRMRVAAYSPSNKDE